MNKELKVSYCSLGCKVNQYESEAIINQFLEGGFKLVPFNSASDVYIINTCSVTKTGEDKSRKMIRRAINNNPNAIVAVMGCYSQLSSKAIESIEGVSIVIGTSNRDKLFSLILDKLEKKDNTSFTMIDDIMKVSKYEELKVNKFTDKTRSFVKIQDGCNNFCSYCTIPFARGLVRSRSKEDCINEIQELSNNGVKEIVLTGIDTGSYGKDFENYDLATLLDDICNSVNNLGRLRISSIEESEISDKLLKVMKKHEEHFCLHIHMPLQGSSDKVLTRMNRHYSIEKFKEKVNLIRSYFPLINITTDILTGFCGEENDDFINGMKTIEDIGFGELHVFPYSRRPRTIAYKYLDQVDEITKHIRVNKLLDLNNSIAIKYREKFLNKELDVIVEENKNGICYGHSSNYINISFNGSYKSNDLVKVKLIEATYPSAKGIVSEEK